LSSTSLPSRAIDTAIDTASVLGFRIGWSAVRALPESAAYGLFNRVADAAVLRNGKGVRRLRANYARVRPELSATELDDLVHDGMRSYMRYYCEAFRLPSLRREQIDRAVRAVGAEEPTAIAATGQAVVVFVGHLGNFDLAAAWSASHIAPVTTVAERLEPEEVFQEFVAFRNSIDMDIIPLTGGGDPFAALLASARAGGRVIALASDRDLTSNGVEVDLLGHRARMAKGPAVLALMTGAPLYCASIHYERAPRGEGLGGHRTVIEFSGQLTPRVAGPTAARAADLIQQCADHLAGTIREHTPSWHMLQRVFVDDLQPVRAGRPPQSQQSQASQGSQESQESSQASRSTGSAS
jgi:KDO2-lipid IV(A) lauroyltransferase